MSSFDPVAVRADFPILSREIGGKPLVYLDNGATTQKPRRVIEALSRFFSNENANIHRGVHYLSQQATTAYEAARRTIQHYIGAKAPEEIGSTAIAVCAVNIEQSERASNDFFIYVPLGYK